MAAKINNRYSPISSKREIVKLSNEQQVRIILPGETTGSFIHVQERNKSGELSPNIKLPGGVRHKGETLDVALRREVEEEVGVKIFALTPITMMPSQRKGKTGKIVRSNIHFYYGSANQLPPAGKVLMGWPLKKDEQGSITDTFWHLNLTDLTRQTLEGNLRSFEDSVKALDYFVNRNYVTVTDFVKPLLRKDVQMIYKETGIPVGKEARFLLRKNTSLDNDQYNLLMTTNRVWYEGPITLEDQERLNVGALDRRRAGIGKNLAEKIIESIVANYKA